MHLRLITLLLLLAFSPLLLQSQSAKDITVPVTATLEPGPFGGVTLSWTMPGAGNLQILRRTKGQTGNQWINILTVNNTTQTSLTDNSTTTGQTYEYAVQRQLGALYAYGYAHVAVEKPVVDQRGKVLLFVDSSLYTPLLAEIDRLKKDLAGDGWTVVEHISGAASTVATIKTQIVADYNADPTNVKSVFLLGAIPIPYSGNTNWDGHTEHAGAWPSDGYYADINGTWTDVSVNNVSPARSANDNVPGDGKFDPSVLPGLVELEVGRVDFRRLVPADFGVASVNDLYKRYLDKNHDWRIKAYTVENKALVDDNFGYFSGEAFAANGWRNAYPLVGEANVEAGDFFNNSNPQRYLMGYGCGGGTYTSAGGVGSSSNFGLDTVNIVFSMLFGSYHGDWDYETNPFMPSALASRGGILNCSWAGRPHWFYQALASGESIGYCAKETKNTQFNNGFYGSLGESGAHTALLGDPTVRAHMVAPAQNLTTTIENCGDVVLQWTASADTGILGYNLYRSTSSLGGFAKLNNTLLTGTTYTDVNPVADTLYYQVRAVFRQTSPGGGAYLNNSTGVQTSLIYQTPAQPNLTLTGGTFTCVTDSVWIMLSSDQPLISAVWNGSGVNNVPGDSLLVIQPGTYTVLATAQNGCTASKSITTSLDVVPPTVNATGGVITCNEPTVTLSGFVSPGSTFVWSGPGIVQPDSLNTEVSVPGVYTLIATDPDNGCTSQATAAVTVDTSLPVITFPSSVTLTCLEPSAVIGVPNIPGMLFYVDGQPVQPGTSVNISDPGAHTLTVESINNGCTKDYVFVVETDVDVPISTITATSDELSCNTPTVTLTASSNSPQVTYQWSGPGITPPNEFVQSPEISQPGTYTVVVTNMVNGCNSAASYQITNAGDQPAAFAMGDTLTCGQPAGQLSGNSDTPGATFAWSGPNNFTSNQANPMVDEPGLYILVVTSPGGCTGSDFTEVVLLPNDLGLVMTATTNTCDNDTFAISPVVNGGVAPYTFLWFNGATTETILVSTEELLNVGVTITDVNGCVASFGVTNLVVIQPPSAVVINNIDLVDISAPGASDGSISVNATGGLPPYQYLWSNGEQGNTIVNLSAGFYAVTVTDANGCTYETSFPIGISSTQDPASVLRFELTPNPGYGPLTLYLELATQADLHLLVFDASGKLVMEQSGLNTDVLTLPLNLEGETPGMYTFMMRINGRIALRRWVLLR
ncbi:MAG: hypothetical protein IT270_08475 [Saprospiraceae bacterium]|nr:hypothetical protein [Saprospiraceae bacterium]